MIVNVGGLSDVRGLGVGVRDQGSGIRTISATPRSKAADRSVRPTLAESKSPLLAEDARNGAPAPSGTRVWIGDPAEAQYVQTTPAHLLEIAARLVAAQGLLRIEGEWAEATPGLMMQAERFENARRAAVEELEKKHAFERA